jgi:hypothetical protein
MFVADPICCAIPGARNHCDHSFCCVRIGKWGFRLFDSHRKPIMLSLAFLAVVSAILSLIPIISMSHRPSVVMNTCWTKGTISSTQGADTNLYIGLSTVVFQTGDNLIAHDWKSSNCTNIDYSNRDYCEQCNSACDATIRVAILNFLTSLPTIATDLKRSTRQGDLNCQKFMSILTGVVGTATTLSSISLFLDGCFRHLPEYSVDGRIISYSFGPGLICILVPQILKPLDVLVNLFTPVGSRGDDDERGDGRRAMDCDHRLLDNGGDESDDLTVEL